MFSKTKFILCFVFLLALVLRVAILDKVPTGIHGDEASIGYNAYSLLKTLRDQNNNFLPLAIDQFGDFRPAGYHYLDIPFVAIFGLNEWSLRLPAAIFGSLSVIIFYLFLKELLQNNKIALIASILLAISPWHINISRATSEGVIAGFFILLGFYFILRGVKSKQVSPRFFIFSVLSFIISFLFYHSARMFVPVLLIPFVGITFYQYSFDKRKLFYSLGSFVAIFFVLVLLFTLGGGSSRPTDISILNIPGGTTEVKHQQDQDGTQNPLLTRFFHNKLYFYTKAFLTSYFQHVNGEYLFLNNGLPIRYKIPWTGNLYLIELPFLIIGFAILLAEGIKQKKLLYLIPIVWLLIATVPAGLTWEDIPNVQRSSLMIYALVTIIAFGISETSQLLKKYNKVFFVVCFLFFLHNFLYFSHNYYYHSQREEPWHRSASVKDLVFKVNNLSKEYEKVIMTTQGNNNLIFHLFYNNYDPALFHKLGSPREKDKLEFHKAVFVHNPCPLDDGAILKTNNYIYIMKENCPIPDFGKVIDVVRHPDGSSAYHLVRLKVEE